MSKRIIAIAFQELRPFSLLVEDDGLRCTYDVDYCRRDNALYYHMSGCGDVHLNTGLGPVWIADGVPTESDRPFMRILNPDPKWLDPEMAWGSNSETEYCEACDDWLPTDEEGGEE